MAERQDRRDPREHRDPRERDIDRYRPEGDASSAARGISDIRYPASPDVAKERPDSDGPGEVSDIRYPISAAREGADSGGIHGYRPSASAAPAASAGLRVTQDEFMARMPLYQETEFETIEEYLAAMENMWRRENGLDPLSPRELQRPPTLDEKGARQVGLRVPGKDYELLVELSDQSGVAPATMARILVVRAVRAAAQLAEIED